MLRTPFRRALAVLLCAQPVLWVSDVALAQTLQQLQQQAQQQYPAQQYPAQQVPQPGLPQPGPQGAQPPGMAPAPAGTAPGSLFPSPAPSPAVPGEADPLRAERQAAALPAAAAAVDEPLDPDRYVCGPGDVLELNFWGVQNFRLRVTVDLEGRAFVPKVGYLRLQGRTLTEVRRVLRESVARYFPALGFDLTLAEPRTFLVQLVDAVPRPGSHPARAIDRVATLLARAGGFGPGASRRRVEVRRRDGTVLVADLQLYALTGEVKHNPHLLDGDVVRVPFEGLAATVEGAVNRPGRYELVGTRDLAELVELAGGLSPAVTRSLPVSVVRRSADDRQDQKLVPFAADGGLPPAPIQHEDLVRISGFVDLQQSVMVMGALAGVSSPDDAFATRRLLYARGDSVRTVLERVGGVGPLADLRGSYLMRGGESLPVDLYALIMLRDLGADRPVELGDSLVVPFKRRSVLVEGAVFKPGSYQYNPSYGISQYLSLAGGRNRFAQPIEEVRLVTADGETKEYAPDLKVEPGSLLVVPERNFSRSEVVQIALSVAGILLSGAALIISVRK